jgi:glycosyltransferase involved in cell wall biosynthesis
MSARPIRILELRSVRGTGGGPEKTIILGTARTDPAQFDITVCYLRDARDAVFAVDAQARELGERYTEIVERRSLDPGIWRPLRQLVDDRRIDIVHSHDYKTDFLTWLLARRGNVRALATCHGWIDNSWRERRLYNPVDKWLLARFPRVIAVSGAIRDELVRCGSSAAGITVVPNGIDAATVRRVPSEGAAIRATLGISEHEVVIAGVGRLDPLKRFDLLVGAFAQLSAQHPERSLRLVIVGEGEHRAALTQQVGRLGLRDQVRLLGQRNDVARLHHAFDLFVQASHTEGAPNAVLEAMALETPIVATSVGGTAELVRHDVDGLLVPRDDETALVAAMERVLLEPEAARRRSASARRRVETELSFDSRMHRVEDIYRELMSDRRWTPSPTERS